MVLVETHIFPHPPNADLCWLARKQRGLFDWLIDFYFILFYSIFDFDLFICLFVFLRQKKGIHEGDT